MTKLILIGFLCLASLFSKAQSKDTVTRKTSIADSVFVRVEEEAMFPSGQQAWLQYISGYLGRYYDKLTKAGDQGTCRVSFIVSKDGSVKDAEAMNMEGTLLAKVCVKAVMHSPKWQPARQNGKVVNAYRVQPITFRIQVQQ